MSLEMTAREYSKLGRPRRANTISPVVRIALIKKALTLAKIGAELGCTKAGGDLIGRRHFRIRGSRTLSTTRKIKNPRWPAAIGSPKPGGNHEPF